MIRVHRHPRAAGDWSCQQDLSASHSPSQHLISFCPSGCGASVSESTVTLFLSAVVATLTAAVAAPLLSRNLRLENQRMRGAINNMSQGLCMFDGNERLVVCNRRYMQMYNLSADIVTPRSTLHSLLEYRMRKVRRTAPPSASKRGTSAALRTS